MTNKSAISVVDEISEDTDIAELRARVRRASLGQIRSGGGPIRHRPAVRLHSRRNSGNSSLIGASLACTSAIVQVKYQQRKSSLTLAHHNFNKKTALLEDTLQRYFQFI